MVARTCGRGGSSPHGGLKVNKERHTEVPGTRQTLQRHTLSDLLLSISCFYTIMTSNAVLSRRNQKLKYVVWSTRNFSSELKFFTMSKQFFSDGEIFYFF
jgi:hypothetical protein